MNKFLRAIGFETFTTRKQLDTLMHNCLAKKQDDTIIHHRESSESLGMFEILTFVGDRVLIYWCGDYTEGEYQLDSYIPTALSGRYIMIDMPEFEIKKDSFGFVGICERPGIGVPLIFSLVNNCDCYDALSSKKPISRCAIAFTGLSVKGNILLPIEKKEKRSAKQKNMERYNLVEKAKNGDESAIQALAFEDIDLYTKLNKRVHKEDIFTIVDSSFMPVGLECDQYSVVGDIENVRYCENRYTKKTIVIMDVVVNDFVVMVAIGQDDLVGEPKRGRRFKGEIWLQGHCIFDGEKLMKTLGETQE